jgi:predicted RNA-binding Zn ribbon-like protein
MPNLIGGALCLDFVNTVDPRHTPERREYLDAYPALVAWAGHAGAIDADQGERLRAAAAGDPAGAERVLSRAIRLREALYPLFSRAAREQAPAPDDLDVLQAELTRALPHLRVTWSPAGYTREWERDSPALDQALWPVAWSAAELLVQGPLERIRECAGQGTCGWLFLDLSKNASRRWCDMRVCGNRAKARRHYARSAAENTEDVTSRRALAGRRGPPG